MRHTLVFEAVASILSICAVSTLVAVSTPAMAGAQQQQAATPPIPSAKDNQAHQPTTLQTVMVTGSHIPGVALASDNPVVTISAQRIQATGKPTLGDIVASLPAITGLVSNSNPEGGGTTTVGLRGLGASRTLILVNGQRIINKDLNSIPTAAIENVQVLTSGASAIYGSDAIGGVINFILKPKFNGAKVSVNYGISSHGDGQRVGESFMFGTSSHKGSFYGAISHTRFDKVTVQSRGYLRSHAQFLNPSGTGFNPGGTNFTPRGFIQVPQALSDKFGCSTAAGLTLNQSAFNSGKSPVAPGDFHCFGAEPGDLYDFLNHGTLLVTPSANTNVMLNGVFHLTPNIDIFATYYHYKERETIPTWPAVFGTRSVAADTISQNSYYNPFGVAFAQPDGSAISTLTNLGTLRYFKLDDVTDQFMGGVRGHGRLFGHSWIWDVELDYGHISDGTQLIGWPNQPFLLKGLGPSFLNSGGIVQCGTPAAPVSLSACTPWDAFDMNSPSARATMANPQATLPVNESNWRIERTYEADAAGGLFELPAGTVRIALGLGYRTEYENNSIGALAVNPPPPSIALCGLGSQCSAHLNGGYDVRFAYGQLDVPILRDLPFVHSLRATLADRTSKYSDFGTTTNWKIGLTYRPISDLLLRGTESKVFRAPTIADLFAAPQSTSTFLQTDPCDGITTPGNPACVGVPTNGSFDDIDDENRLQLRAQSEGAKAAGLPIQPEHGKTFDVGVVYSPHAVPGLTVSVDKWRIYLQDTITQLSAQTVMDECFNGNLIYCKFIQRAQGGPSAGQLNLIARPTGNLGRIDVSGTDISAAYRLPDLTFGQLSLNMDASYLNQYIVQTAPGQVSNTVSDLAGTKATIISQLFPRWRGQLGANWEKGPWSARWELRYIGGFRDAGFSSAQCHESFNCFGGWVYNDMSVGYDIEPIKTKVRFGIDNVFNKQPPMMGLNIGDSTTNTDTNNYDAVGRFFWVNASVRF